MRPKLSAFPLHRPFERLSASTPLSELTMRLVVDFDSDSPEVIGSCMAFCGHLLMTSKHVLSKFLRNGAEHSLYAIQIVEGSKYVLWSVVGGWGHPLSDISLLHLASKPGVSDTSLEIVHKQFVVDPFHPGIGESVAAFGYHSSRIDVSKNPDGSRHIDLRDEPTASVGRITAVYPEGRDKVMLPFPCFEVEARFDGGMSGGPVFDETGAVCGIICSGIDGAHESGAPVSYVTTIWPIFGMIINADRQGPYPRGVSYPVIELVHGGQVQVPNLPALEKRLSAPNWPKHTS